MVEKLGGKFSQVAALEVHPGATQGAYDSNGCAAADRGQKAVDGGGGGAEPDMPCLCLCSTHKPQTPGCSLCLTLKPQPLPVPVPLLDSTNHGTLHLHEPFPRVAQVWHWMQAMLAFYSTANYVHPPSLHPPPPPHLPPPPPRLPINLRLCLRLNTLTHGCACACALPLTRSCFCMCV